MKYTSASVRHRKGRGWQGIAKYKDGDTWKAVYKSFPDAKGKAEAKRMLAEWRQELERLEEESPVVHADAMTVAEFMAYRLDTLEASGNVERSTVSGYRYSARHVCEAFGDVLLTELNAETIQAWVNSMTNTRSIPTTRKALNVLRATLSDAVELGYLERNPMTERSVKAPRLARPNPNALDAESRARLVSFLDTVEQTPVTIAIRLALYTGMREGEICALRWRNVNLEAGTISIREAIGRDGGQTYIKEPKTGGSVRDVPLPGSLAPILSRRMKQMKAECLAHGVPFRSELFVLGAVDGSYLSYKVVSNGWNTIRDALGLSGVAGKRPTFHDLRHTFASAAIASGADVKSVSSILGHASAAMTLDIYASADPKAKAEAMKAVEASMTGQKLADVALFRANGTEG